MEKKSYGGKILADCIRDLGVNKVFTVPGESFLPALNGLYDHKNKIDVITCRHESGAANMAEAWGKLTGFPGVVFVTRGPGACHASIGVTTAMHDSSPMVMFIGQIHSKHKGREAFQEVDYFKMFSQPFSKAIFEIKNADDRNTIKCMHSYTPPQPFTMAYITEKKTNDMCEPLPPPSHNKLFEYMHL